jgi:hypothetical protein
MRRSCPGTGGPCHDAFVLPYAAYLRVYEPLSAFSDAGSRQWAAYAESPGRPRRAGALEAEQTSALRRIIALPPIIAPEEESEHAYVRWAEGVTYICPWQTRLRSWLAVARLRATDAPLLAAAFPGGQGDRAAGAFARWQGQASSLRVYIQVSTWSVPLSWFAPFTADERWLVLGPAADSGERAATASVTRTLVYSTAMPEARRRVARALGAIRRAQGKPASGLVGAADDEERKPRVAAELEAIGSWLEEFHPHSLVELDYGGLVHTLPAGELEDDHSAADVAEGIEALRQGDGAAAGAAYARLVERWRSVRDRRSAN